MRDAVLTEANEAGITKEELHKAYDFGCATLRAYAAAAFARQSTAAQVIIHIQGSFREHSASRCFFAICTVGSACSP
jgi:hypothetical protein